MACLTSSVSACLGISCRKEVTQPSACARWRSWASTTSRVSLETWLGLGLGLGWGLGLGLGLGLGSGLGLGLGWG